MTLTQEITGARNFRTIFVFFVLLLAGLGFFLAGISSYFHVNFLRITDTNNIAFLPQGLTMTFYGTTALMLAIYLGFTVLWNIGSGYNEFSKKEQIIRIVRLGFPGKYREIFFTYEFKNIKNIIFFIKEGLNPRYNILLRLKDNREIPLFPANYLLNPSETEKKAIFLANFLEVNLEKRND
jgi:hypothetical protein